MVIVLYVGIILLATISGAIAGLGGGVIIKPLFDLIGYHDASTIGFYSSAAVFTMCIVSLIKQIRKGFTFDAKTILFVSLGSVAGGLLGETIFNEIASQFDNHMVKVIQAALLGVTLVAILIYTIYKDRFRGFRLKNGGAIFAVGCFLGAISVFLGIGGGPMNVALFILLFSYPMKQAAIYSIVTIFFSQISKLGQIVFSGALAGYDLTFLPFICIAAVAGGFIGTMINQRLDDRRIEKFYLFLIVVLIVISVYNVITNLQ